MSPDELRLVAAALFGIALSVLCIVKGRLHPFIGLLCGALAVGFLSGMAATDTFAAVKKGVGDILGGTGLVVALGLTLGCMLHLSNGAKALAQSALAVIGEKAAPWGSLFIAMLIGLPLFFETGLVLILPVIAAAAASLASGRSSDEQKLRLFLPALTGLSVVHALIPPHPGPVLAVTTLGADMGRTMLWGLVIAVPTAIIAGPLLARFTTRNVEITAPLLSEQFTSQAAPGALRTLIVVLLPVLLIAMGLFHNPADKAGNGLITTLSNPVMALLITNLVALPLLFGQRMRDGDVLERIWSQAMESAGTVLLAIGAGGALKQVLVSAGLADLLSRLAALGAMSPIILAWLIAVGVRLATGSATVATITTAGVMVKAVSGSGVDPTWFVLAIGAGSVFFSHVNDPGFWLVKSYVGVSTADNFKIWSSLETAISVVALMLILLASHLVG